MPPEDTGEIPLYLGKRKGKHLNPWWRSGNCQEQGRTTDRLQPGAQHMEGLKTEDGAVTGEKQTENLQQTNPLLPTKGSEACGGYIKGNCNSSDA